MNRPNVVLPLAGLTALLALLCLAGSSTATQTGDVYSGSGSWSVFNPTTVSDEMVNVSGNIDLYSSLTLSNAQIRFTTNNTVLTVRSGSLTMSPGGGTSLITTSVSTYYFQFIVQSGASSVNLQNTTVDHVNGGIQVSGGTAANRYFAHVSVTHAKSYGFYLTDSAATIFNAVISLDINPAMVVSDYWSNSTYNYGSYGYNYAYRYISHTWTATGIGVQTVRGTPWIDGVEVHVPDVAVRLDVTFLGGFVGEFNYYYSYGCGPTNWYNYTYTYDSLYASMDVYGFRGLDSRFARFENVRPPSENFSVDLHWTMGGNYAYSYFYCNPPYPNYPQRQSYSYPEQVVYGFNTLQFSPQNVVGVYLQNAGIGNLTNLNLAMGRVGVSVTSDWAGPQWALDYFATYYSYLSAPQVYALWSTETSTTTTFSPVTRTDVSLTNSFVTGAGVRIDRNYYYYAPAAPGGANNTVFRGDALVDNVTVIGAGAIGIDLRVYAYSSPNYNRYDYTARVERSYISAARPLSLSLPNQVNTNTNYTAAITIADNTFENSTYKATNNFLGLITIDTGGHSNTFSSDWYKADVTLRDNTIANMRGPLVGWGYSDYRFAGGSSLTLSGNSLSNLNHSWISPAAGGGKGGSGGVTEAFIKTTADSVTLSNNSFDGLAFVHGILGGAAGGDPQVPYLDFAYCARYGYTGYGCSWPYKTPTITIVDNTFAHIAMEQNAGPNNAFALAAGRGTIVFERNRVDDSTAVLVHAYLYYFSSYAFPTEAIDVTVRDNTVSNQTQRPAILYTSPYRGGQPMRLYSNTYSDSTKPFVGWQLDGYGNFGYRPAEYLATLIVDSNVFLNLTLGQDAAVHLAGRPALTNNLWNHVSGWAVIAEHMGKIPNIAGNTILDTTNGYWFIPSVLSGIKPTAQFSDLDIQVYGTGIRMENGNLLLVRINFGDAALALDMVDGYAEVYSSRIRVLSGRVAGDASINVYNELGYEVRWADAEAQDSGVVVPNALIVASSSDHTILTSGHTGADGRIAPRTIGVWNMIAFGSRVESHVDLPLEVLTFAGGIQRVINLPALAPGEELSFFEDYPAYPVLLVDPILPEVSVGFPLAGATVGSSDVTVRGYTFERGSGLAAQRVRVDGGPWTTISDFSSTWDFTLEGLDEGAHTLRVEVLDVATNTGSVDLEFFVDITPPTLTLTAPVEAVALTNSPVYNIRGHVEPADSTVALNGIPVAVNSRGDFFYNLSLSDGLNVVRLVATDLARNSATLSRTIEYDRHAPFLEVEAPVNRLLTNHPTVDVLGRSERDARVTVNGLPAFVNPVDGTFILPEMVLDDLFAQTENLLIIRAVDPAGNIAFENRTVVLDTQAPAIDLEIDPDLAARIAAGLPVSATTLNVQGITDSSDATITIAGQQVSLQGLSFSRVLVLREGVNLVTVGSSDEAGNTRQVSLRIVRDTVKPVLALLTPTEPSLLTNQSSLLVSGFTDTPGSVVTLSYTDALGSPASLQVATVGVGVPVQYRFEQELELVTDGNPHIVEVRASDAAGNADSASFEYTAKVGKPFLELSGLAQRTSQTFVYVNGTTDVGIDTVRINGQTFPVVAQFFSVRWNLPIQEGNYTLTVSVRDEAGNTNTVTARVQVDAAPAPPAPPAPTPFYSDLSVQVGIGAGLLGSALAVLVFSLRRRRGAI